MPKKVSKPTKQTHASFAKQFEELEKIVASFEEDELDVDASLERFEKGLHIAEQLKKTLAETENRIETLKRKYQLDVEE